MAGYPSFFPFRTHVYQATVITTSAGGCEVPNATRGRLVAVYAAPNTASQANACLLDITVNGSTAGADSLTTGLGKVSYGTTTTTAGGSFKLYDAVWSQTTSTSTTLISGPAFIYVQAGDVLGTITSSAVVTTVSFVVQEG